MSREMVSDPGVGSKSAPVGSEDWAKSIRLSLQNVIGDLPKAPERAKRYLDAIKKHRAWTLLNKEDGSSFVSFDEFCSYKYPWGLGKPYSEIEPFLKAALGKRHLQLVTVAPAQQGTRVDLTSAHDGPKLAPATAKRLRAIAERAPECVRELYRQGLIGQDVAAKLGPKSPTPDEAKRVHEVAYALEEQAKALGKPKDEAQRKEMQKALNRRARQLLGDTGDDPKTKAMRAMSRVVPVVKWKPPTVTIRDVLVSAEAIVKSLKGDERTSYAYELIRIAEEALRLK